MPSVAFCSNACYRFAMLRAVFILIFVAFSACSIAEVSEFRIDQDRLWLRAENEPLSSVLEHFAAAGVAVQADPAAEKTVTGDWSDADIETALGQILSPYDYLLDWQREVGPLGSRVILTGIRVYRKGLVSEAQPLLPTRRIATSLDGKTRFVAREILVGFGPDSDISDLRAFLARTGGSVIEANTTLGIYRILLPAGVNIPELAAQLANDPSIVLAEPNYVTDLPELLPGDEETASTKWSSPASAAEIAVSVLDSGLIKDAGLSAAVVSAYDATNPDAPLTADAVGHGTLMAKLAAGLVDPYNTAVNEGVSVVAVKAFADDGFADSFTMMNAITHAVENSSGPVSLSWGTETPSRFIETAVNYAIENGSPVFAAVGNENTGTPIYPAACAGVIGVAAGDENGAYTEYSNRGDFVDIIAPGSAGGSQGTSVATAYVSHVAGLYMQRNPNVTSAEAVQALIAAAGADLYLSEEDVRLLLAK
jgi:hypothetical protein